MSGRIDVANYENQHMLNNMRKKLRAAVAKEDEDAMGCSGRVGTVRGILTSEEIDELYEIPKIDAEDRELLFEITVEDEVYLEQQKSIYNKINY